MIFLKFTLIAILFLFIIAVYAALLVAVDVVVKQGRRGKLTEKTAENVLNVLTCVVLLGAATRVLLEVVNAI